MINSNVHVHVSIIVTYGFPFRAHLTNEDFRKLLMTPQPQSVDDSAARPHQRRESVGKEPGTDSKRAKKKRFANHKAIVCLI